MSIRVRISNNRSGKNGGTENPLCGRCGTSIKDTEYASFQNGKFYHDNRSTLIKEVDCFLLEFPDEA